MADKEIGVVISTQGIAPSIPKALPVTKLIVDDFVGDGGESILTDRNESTYKPPEPIEATTLGSAFEQFKPHQNVTITVQEGEGKEEYRVGLNFANMNDFTPDSYERRIPELRDLAAEKRGLEQLLTYLETPDGAHRLRELLDNTEYHSGMEELRKYLESYLQASEGVLPEIRDRQPDSKEP